MEFGERLVGSFPGGSGVDEVARLDAEGGAPIDTAFPTNAGFGKALVVFLKEEGLGVAVTDLLFEVFPEGGAAVVPNEGSGGKSKRESGIAEAPAEVDIVSGSVKDGVETLDFLEG